MISLFIFPKYIFSTEVVFVVYNHSIRYVLHMSWQKFELKIQTLLDRVFPWSMIHVNCIGKVYKNQCCIDSTKRSVEMSRYCRPTILMTFLILRRNFLLTTLKSKTEKTFPIAIRRVRYVKDLYNNAVLTHVDELIPNQSFSYCKDSKKIVKY